MQTTVDMMSIFEASWVASKFECVAMLKKVSKMKSRSSQKEFTQFTVVAIKQILLSNSKERL